MTDRAERAILTALIACSVMAGCVLGAFAATARALATREPRTVITVVPARDAPSRTAPERRAATTTPKQI